MEGGRSVVHLPSDTPRNRYAILGTANLRPFRNFLAMLAATAGAGLVARNALADEPGDPHAHHRDAMAALKRARASTRDLKLPDVKLVREDGKTVSLAEELSDGGPVVLNFIFTSCTSICPVMSGTFAQLQARLGGDLRAPVHMVSISIDPEYDTPPRLASYAKRFQAGPQWRFYTGTPEASLAVQRAFGASTGDKMDHTPVTFLRAGPGARWVRIDGFASSDELAGALQELVSGRLPQ
jgi:protein SCO1/2